MIVLRQKIFVLPAGALKVTAAESAILRGSSKKIPRSVVGGRSVGGQHISSPGGDGFTKKLATMDEYIGSSTNAAGETKVRIRPSHVMNKQEQEFAQKYIKSANFNDGPISSGNMSKNPLTATAASTPAPQPQNSVNPLTPTGQVPPAGGAQAPNNPATGGKTNVKSTKDKSVGGGNKSDDGYGKSGKSDSKNEPGWWSQNWKSVAGYGGGAAVLGSGLAFGAAGLDALKGNMGNGEGY